VVIGANAIAVVYLFGGVIIGTACVNVPAELRAKDRPGDQGAGEPPAPESSGSSEAEAHEPETSP
jgi:hypothetical protein